MFGNIAVDITFLRWKNTQICEYARRTSPLDLKIHNVVHMQVFCEYDHPKVCVGEP